MQWARVTLVSILFLTVLTVVGVHADQQKLRIIFYAGNPEINSGSEAGGLPALLTLLEEEQVKSERTLFLHGGGAIAASTMASFDRGAHMIDLLNQLSPAVFSVAKSELSYGEDELTLRSFEAAFPLISSNLYDTTTGTSLEGLEPYIIIDSKGISIGIISIMDPEVVHEYLPDRARIKPTAEIIDKVAPELRELGADLIILMADYHPPQVIAYLESGLIDMVLVGDSLNKSFTGDQAGIIEHARDDSVAIIDLEFETDQQLKLRNHNTRFVQLTTTPPHPSMQRGVKSYLAKLQRLLGVQIGITNTELDTTEAAVRTGENGFGNLVADAIRIGAQAEIGIMNGGGIRGNRIYPPGTIMTRGDIHREIPFRNTVVAMRITGAQLLAGLENGFSRLEEVKGRFPHVSGMRVDYNPSKPVGERVNRVEIQGKILNPEQTYTLAVPDFLAEGGDGYVSFQQGEKEKIADGNKLLWEYVRDYIADNNIISPSIEGRLNRVKE